MVGADRSSSAMTYDDGNIFARILRGEVPCKRVHETDHALAFHDINPLAPTHLLVIPKGRYVSMADFSANASTEEIAGFFRAVGETAQRLGVVERGYRILANNGADANQEVPHFHVHIFGGAPLGPMLRRIEQRQSNSR
jgi:histidine triad (HIT) family protein